MEKCNGWTNRETWLVSLWFGDSLDMMLREAHTLHGTSELTADSIRELVEEYLEFHLPSGDGDKGFIRDMMDMAAVNWAELAENYKG